MFRLPLPPRYPIFYLSSAKTDLQIKKACHYYSFFRTPVTSCHLDQPTLSVTCAETCRRLPMRSTSIILVRHTSLFSGLVLPEGIPLRITPVYLRSYVDWNEQCVERSTVGLHQMQMFCGFSASCVILLCINNQYWYHPDIISVRTAFRTDLFFTGVSWRWLRNMLFYFNGTKYSFVYVVSQPEESMYTWLRINTPLSKRVLRWVVTKIACCFGLFVVSGTS